MKDDKYKKDKEAQQLVVQEYIRTEVAPTEEKLPQISIPEFTEEFLKLCEMKQIYMTINKNTGEVLSLHAADARNIELLMMSLNNVYATIIESGIDNEIIDPILDVIEGYYRALKEGLRNTKKSRLH